MFFTEVAFYASILTVAELVFIVIAMFRTDVKNQPTGGDFLWSFIKFYALNLIFIAILSK